MKTKLEEAAEKFAVKEINSCESYHDLHYGFLKGAQWQSERMYSKEDMQLAFEAGYKKGFSGYPNTENWKELPFEPWFTQFKPTGTNKNETDRGEITTMRTTTDDNNPDNNTTVNTPSLRKHITNYLNDISTHGTRNELIEATNVLHDFMLYINEMESDEIFEDNTPNKLQTLNQPHPSSSTGWGGC